MKDEYKILIGAVIVILIVLVGAFALSGSNNGGPTATPTVLPVTVTPTAVPVGPSPSANPTAAPTAVPTVTPSTEPASGVKQTEFGYWITYPPLGPENWSSPHPPVGAGVFNFDTASATIDADYLFPSAEGNYRRSNVVRTGGDMNATVNVTLHMSTSDNAEWQEDEDAVDYVITMHGEYGGNLTELGNGDYVMKFGPGMTEQYVCVHAESSRELRESQAAGWPEGWARITITGADNGYSPGAARDFTVNIKNLPLVGFDEEGYGYLWSSNGYVNNSSEGFHTVDASGDIVYLTLPIYREINRNGPLTVTFDWYVYDGAQLSNDAITVQPYTFADGQEIGYVTVGIKKADIIDANWHQVYIDIVSSDNYNIYTDEFRIDLNMG